MSDKKLLILFEKPASEIHCNNVRAAIKPFMTRYATRVEPNNRCMYRRVFSGEQINVLIGQPISIDNSDPTIAVVPDDMFNNNSLLRNIIINRVTPINNCSSLHRYSANYIVRPFHNDNFTNLCKIINISFDDNYRYGDRFIRTVDNDYFRLNGDYACGINIRTFFDRCGSNFRVDHVLYEEQMCRNSFQKLTYLDTLPELLNYDFHKAFVVISVNNYSDSSYFVL